MEDTLKKYRTDTKPIWVSFFKRQFPFIIAIVFLITASLLIYKRILFLKQTSDIVIFGLIFICLCTFLIMLGLFLQNLIECINFIKRIKTNVDFFDDRFEYINVENKKLHEKVYYSEIKNTEIITKKDINGKEFSSVKIEYGEPKKTVEMTYVNNIEEYIEFLNKKRKKTHEIEKKDKENNEKEEKDSIFYQ